MLRILRGTRRVIVWDSSTFLGLRWTRMYRQQNPVKWFLACFYSIKSGSEVLYMFGIPSIPSNQCSSQYHVGLLDVPYHQTYAECCFDCRVYKQSKHNIEWSFWLARCTRRRPRGGTPRRCSTWAGCSSMGPDCPKTSTYPSATMTKPWRSSQTPGCQWLLPFPASDCTRCCHCLSY